MVRGTVVVVARRTGGSSNTAPMAPPTDRATMPPMRTTSAIFLDRAGGIPPFYCSATHG